MEISYAVPGFLKNVRVICKFDGMGICSQISASGHLSKKECRTKIFWLFLISFTYISLHTFSHMPTAQSSVPWLIRTYTLQTVRLKSCETACVNRKYSMWFQASATTWMSSAFWDISTPFRVIYRNRADLRIYTEVKKKRGLYMIERHWYIKLVHSVINRDALIALVKVLRCATLEIKSL